MKRTIPLNRIADGLAAIEKRKRAMSTTRFDMRVILSVGLLAVCGAAFAGEPFAIDWHTVDGGGGTSSGGDFLLTGTIGQSDASSAGAPLSGGDFELVGGFLVGGGGCGATVLFGDVAPRSGVIDFEDILCVVDGFADISACPQGDIVGANTQCPPFEPNGIDFDDILAVVDAFTGNPSCPDPCPPPGP